MSDSQYLLTDEQMVHFITKGYVVFAQRVAGSASRFRQG